MKVFAVVFAVLIAAVAFVSAGGYGGSSAGGSSYGGSAGGSSYGGSAPASIPAPPCPKNYLFSCQPSLAPAPCSQQASAGGYGSAGAYSEQVPTWVNAPIPVGYQYHGLQY